MGPSKLHNACCALVICVDAGSMVDSTNPAVFNKTVMLAVIAISNCHAFGLCIHGSACQARPFMHVVVCMYVALQDSQTFTHWMSWQSDCGWTSGSGPLQHPML